MWFWRLDCRDCECSKMCAQAHVQMLAQEWGPPLFAHDDSRRRDRGRPTPRHHHFHLPLHAMHG